MNATIRRCTEHDVDGLVDIAVRAWEPVFASLAKVLGTQLHERLTPDWLATQEQGVRDSWADDEREVWVAEVDGELVGFVTLAVFDAERSIGEIQMLAVDPDVQGREIGLALTEHATDLLRQQGMRVALVETGADEGHAPARLVYGRAGFTQLPIARYFKAL